MSRKLDKTLQWISTEKQLPEKGIKVLVLYDTPCVEDEPDVAVYAGDDTWSVGPEEYLDRVYTMVTCWMPIPKREN